MAILHCMQELRLVRSVAMKIFTGSSAAKSISTRHGPGKQSKHISLRYLFVQDLVRSGATTIKKVGTEDNHSDVLTKYVGVWILLHHLTALGIERRPDFGLQGDGANYTSHTPHDGLTTVSGIWRICCINTTIPDRPNTTHPEESWPSSNSQSSISGTTT